MDPLSMAPLSGTKNLGTLKGVLLKNPMFWVLLNAVVNFAGSCLL